MTAPYIENEAEFNTLLETESLLVVDFTASWCGPCKLVAPLIDRLAEEFSGAFGTPQSAKVLKLDLDANKSVAKRFGIRSIPAVVIFKQGELVETIIGAKPYEEFSNTLTKYLEV